MSEEEKAAKKAAKRRKVAEEILQTEKIYVSRLESIVNLFFDPLVAHTNEEKRCICLDDVKTIFGNVKVILGYNQILLQQLSDNFNLPNSEYCVGEIFFKMAEFLKTYSEYCKNYPRSLAVIKQYRETSPDFETLYLKLHDKSILGDATLKDLLIIPVQRIPRYKMLLEEMMKSTPDSHTDYVHLSKALEKITIIALKNEQQQEKYANVSKIVQIQSEFNKKESNAMKLLQPDRVYIRQDVVDFQDNGGPIAKARKMFLFNDLLLIAKSKDSNDKKKKTSLKSVKSIDLNQVSDINSTIVDNRNAITLCFQNHTFGFLFDTKNARDAFEVAILANVENSKDSKNIKKREGECNAVDRRDSKRKLMKKSVSKKSLSSLQESAVKVENPIFRKKADTVGGSRRIVVALKGEDIDLKKSCSMSNFIKKENSHEDENLTRSRSLVGISDHPNDEEVQEEEL